MITKVTHINSAKCSIAVRLIGICLYIFISHWAIAQQLSIQAKLDRSEIKTGEQAVIDVTIRTPNIDQTKFYLQEDPQAGEPYVVVSFLPYDTISLQGTLQEISARMVITSFDSTLITIPPILAETPTEQATTQPMALNVIQPEVDASRPESFKANKDTWDVSVTWLDWLYWFVTRPSVWGILLLGVLLYAYKYYMKHKRETPAQEVKPNVEEISALERAINQLSALRGYPLVNQLEVKIYYTQIIDCLKSYLDEKKGWHTKEMTSQEVLTILDIDTPMLTSLLSSLLREADMSKFAKADMSVSDAEQALDVAISFLYQADKAWANDDTQAQASENTKNA